jgi:ADP-ribosylglycohydrolase
VVLGHAVGDALGVPAEFCSRAHMDAHPICDMVGFGSYPYPAGTWSDDTSMSLCALKVLADGAADWDAIMRHFGAWIDEGAFSPVGECFDVGRACLAAVRRYQEGTPPVDCGGRGEFDNGNGSLMRIHPFVLYAMYSHAVDAPDAFITCASSLTHAHPCAVAACLIYAAVLREVLEAPCKQSVRRGLRLAAQRYAHTEGGERFARLFDPAFESLAREYIGSSGYVVDTLEAAVWCLLTTNSYKECVLCAVNLGEDTDTTAAVAGGLAGALYGYEAIPVAWRETLSAATAIEALCRRAAACWKRI